MQPRPPVSLDTPVRAPDWAPLEESTLVLPRPWGACNCSPRGVRGGGPPASLSGGPRPLKTVTAGAMTPLTHTLLCERCTAASRGLPCEVWS